jgi:hypothetical protein
MTAAPTYPPPLPGRSSLWFLSHGMVISLSGVPLLPFTPISRFFHDPYQTIWAAACTAPAVFLAITGLIMIIRGAFKAHSERMAGYTVMIAVANHRPELLLRHPFTLQPVAAPHVRLDSIHLDISAREFLWW